MRLQEIFNKSKSTKVSLDGIVYKIYSNGEILTESNIPASLNMAQILSDRWKIEYTVKTEESFVGREKYYYVDSELLVSDDFNDGTTIDRRRISNGNAFKNKQYAEIVTLQTKINNKLRTIAHLNNSNNFNPYDKTKTKYSVEGYRNVNDGFKIIINEFEVIVEDCAKFETRELAEQAREFVREDYIKLFDLEQEYYNEKVGN